MKTLARLVLITVFIFAIGLIAFILHGPKDKETWATLAGLLAVIAAVIAVIPALRVLELQEDALRPRPTPYFDLSSRHNLLQLRVKNFGGGIAYKVVLKWKSQPVDQYGLAAKSLDEISVLLPGESASALIGASTVMVKQIGNAVFEGECSFCDSKGKRYREKFICSVDGHQKQLLHDEEMNKTLRDLQDIPPQLSRIADLLDKIIESDSKSNQNPRPPTHKST